jgi:asparagine synthase (glutamine-hydrolysing)
VCGITGVYSFAPERAVESRVLDRMTDVLAHRGPDGRGTHIDGGLGLGHRRLAIIDLSAAAAQPLANESGTVWVVCNGEIYNFRRLRDELASKGHRFRSRSDTEVLVHLYEEEGDQLVERLRGMFAFALWDAQRRRLLLARDRFGQKPLYYRLTHAGLHFASEIKGILADPEVPRQVDERALDDYLTYGYVPAPSTAFVGIHKLPPAHVLTVEADGQHDLRPYWQLRMGPKEPVGAAARSAAYDQLLGLLDEATSLRMVSDVPLGALLSGGVDSSAVVASMCSTRAAGDGSVKTFTIGFEEPGHDESPYAARVAHHLGTDHRTLQLTPESFTGLERIAWHYGEPFADSSCLPTFALAGLARRHVTVALTGDGGDELFCGYRRHLAMVLEDQLRGAPAVLRSVAHSRALIAMLRRARRKAVANDLACSRAHRRLDPSHLYLARLEVLSPEMKSGLYSDAFRSQLDGRDPREVVWRAIASSDGERLAERCAHADALTYLPDDILVKVDVASMAHGLECRAPLLDHKLAEYVAGLPFELKVSRGRRKLALKEAVRGRLPAEVLSRRKKGFSVPLKSWFEGRLEPLLRDTLLSRRALGRGYFDRARVEQLIGEHAAGAAAHQAALFSLLMLELWHRQWIDPSQGSTLAAPGEARVSASHHGPP